MRLHNLSSWMLSLTLFMPLAACDEEDDGGDDSAGDSANGTEGSGNSGNSQTSSSEEVCQSSHECINDVCTCQTPSLEDMPCTDDEACEEECEICM